MDHTMTRQELVAVTESAKNKIIERLVTKFDVQTAVDRSRDQILHNLQALHAENQAMMRQSNAQRDQLWRRLSALESQIAALQLEVRAMHRTIAEREEPASEYIT